MSERKELNLEDMENIAGGAKKKSTDNTNQSIKGQNNNNGMIQNNVVEGNKGDVKIIGPMKIDSGGGTTNLNF